MTNNDKLYIINGHCFVAENTKEALQMWDDYNTGNSDETKEIETMVVDKKNCPIWTRERLKEYLEYNEKMRY